MAEIKLSKGYVTLVDDADLVLSDIVELLRTPTGALPPSKWELAAADEIERLRLALRAVAAARMPGEARRIAVEALR